MARPPRDHGQRKRRAAPDDPGQFQRFMKAARELGCEEGEEAFERAMARIFPPREPGKPAAKMIEDAKPIGSRRREQKPK